MKLFVLLSRVPWPLDKGDKLRAYHQLKNLAQFHEIYLCCLSDNKTPPDAVEHLLEFVAHVKIVRLSKWKQFLQLASGLFVDLPFQVLYFKQRKAQRLVEKLAIDFRPDHILCQMVRTSEYVKTLYQFPKTIDYQDALSAGYDRRRNTVSGWLRPFFKEEARRLKKYEQLVFDYFDFQIIISDQDRQFINHPNRNQILVIPNGVDTTFFTPDSSAKIYDLVFAGNMGYAPNVECAKRIAMHILPLIKAKRPSTNLLIAGAEPTGEVRSLAFLSPDITVSGWMPDIRLAYRSSRILFAPMTIGSGMQNKILEAMSSAIPSITSTLVLGGLGISNEHPILIGQSDEEFAELAVQLLDNEALYSKLAHNSREYVIQYFDWQGQMDMWLKKIAE